MSITTPLSETCAERGIRRVVHCHADHFEPYTVAKQLGPAADVALWLERCGPAVPTLFVSPPIGYQLTTTSLVLRQASTAAIETEYLRTLAALGAGVAVHIHHEAWTCNGLARAKMGPGQAEIHDYVMAQNSPEADHDRLRTMVEAALAWMRDTTGHALETWHFVHGCWAFGASDPEICTLEHELPLLYSLGCRADFSFPAGRQYCNPPWLQPKWVKPVSAIRAFERRAADPRVEYGSDRMLVWGSKVGAWWLGLDTYSLDSRRLTESTDKIERYMPLAPVINGTAYFKTCTHGMHPHYWQDGDPRPSVGAFARELARKCERARVPVEFMTTEQVVRELM